MSRFLSIFNRTATLDDSRIIEAIDFIANESQRSDEELEDHLVRQGYSEDDAFFLIRFVPAAYFRAWFQPKGLEFNDRFMIYKIEKNEQRSLKYKKQPIWNSIYRIAKQELSAGIDEDRLLSLAGRSAEYGATIQMIEKGSRLEDIRFTQAILTDTR